MSMESLYLRVKPFVDLLIALGITFICLPLLLIISALVKLNSPGPIIFKQKRIGHHGKIFTLYKFRTMMKNAHSLKSKYQYLNEAEKPLFKIRNDPRFTPIGRLFSHTGLDELPQLLNVLKGEMSIVGPRPLPIDEGQALGQLQKARERVKPGVTSTWVVSGHHQLATTERIRMDIAYARSVNFWVDIKVIILTIILILRKVTGGFANFIHYKNNRK